MSPESKEDFEEFEAALSEKICQFSESEHYPDCVEKLIKNICLGCKFIYETDSNLNPLGPLFSSGNISQQFPFFYNITRFSHR